VREAEEEIVDELEPLGTFVSNFRVFPFVARIPSELAWTIHPAEVAAAVEQGVPVRMDTYTVDGHRLPG
jgi:hypothetical protein